MRMITFYNFNEVDNDCDSIILDNVKWMHPTETEPDIYGIEFDEYHVNVFDLDDIRSLFDVEDCDYDEIVNLAEALIYNLFINVMGAKFCGDFVELDASTGSNFYDRKVDVTKFLKIEAETFNNMLREYDEDDDEEDEEETDTSSDSVILNINTSPDDNIIEQYINRVIGKGNP